MSRLLNKSKHQLRRKYRVRAKVSGTTERPRLSVFISSTNISAQIIDDTKQKTLVQLSTIGSKEATGTMTERATWLGTNLAKKAKIAKVDKVVLDRNGKLYHGRIKALAEAARAEGLKF